MHQLLIATLRSATENMAPCDEHDPRGGVVTLCHGGPVFRMPRRNATERIVREGPRDANPVDPFIQPRVYCLQG